MRIISLSGWLADFFQRIQNRLGSALVDAPNWKENINQNTSRPEKTVAILQQSSASRLAHQCALTIADTLE